MKMTKTIHTIILSLALVLTGVSCQDSKFKGYTGGNNRDEDNRGGGDQVQPGDSDYNNFPGGGDRPDGADDDQLTNWLGGSLNGLDLTFSMPGKVWHIGDNNFAQTNCKLRVSTNKLDHGRQFVYNFFVENDGTNLGINIYHCGVDVGYGDPVVIEGPFSVSALPSEIYSQELKESSGILSFFMEKEELPRLTLSRGWYKIIVMSGYKSSNNDYDDFIVGKVKIMDPSGPIHLGDVSGG